MPLSLLIYFKIKLATNSVMIASFLSTCAVRIAGINQVL